MNNLLNGIEEILLMGPGPSSVPPEVYDALGKPTIGHLDPYFLKIMDGIKEQLRTLLKTSNPVTVPISGTGSAGMESCFVNLVEPEDTVLVLKNGVFGGRMEDVAGRLRARVKTMEWEWGTPVRVDEVKEELARNSYDLVAVVHAETSTGVCNPVQAIGELVKDTDSIFLVDGVTSLGGMAIEMDGWGIDAFYSGTQKCLSCPPGLAPLSFSEKAVRKLESRKSKVPNWYLDLTMILNYWRGQSRAYHHTAPINMLYALYEALALVLDEGPEVVYRRHLENHRALVKGVEGMGLTMLVHPDHRLPMLNAVRVPDGVDEAAVRSHLRTKHRIEIGAGLGPLAGKIWRIGLMGHTSRPENVERVLEALGEAL
jgi:alanine-glyoxylate transaminase/serine-glyoxylate transaminase/serine-pyruvate transaminase